jgi:hypothetical protein
VLLQHHTTRASDNLTIDINDGVSEADNTLISNVSGKHTAGLFADAALEELIGENAISCLHSPTFLTPRLRSSENSFTRKKMTGYNASTRRKCGNLEGVRKASENPQEERMLN